MSINLYPTQKQQALVELLTPFIITSLEMSPWPRWLPDLRIDPWGKVLVSYIKIVPGNSLVFKVNIISRKAASKVI